MVAASRPKGEVAELKTRFTDSLKLSKKQQLRECFPKLLEYMTKGMDTSSMWAEVTSAAALLKDDVPTKKVFYQYIVYNSLANPQIALMSMNLLSTDALDQDPTVRGLALRSLCSLKVPNLLEHVVQPIAQGLVDLQPYVRRTAVMGFLKCYHVDPEFAQLQGMQARIHQMLDTEEDPQVLANCLFTVLHTDRDGLARLVTQPMVHKLLARVSDFSEWAQVAVLAVCAHFRPTSEDDVYGIMNHLDDRLTHTNPAIVLGAVELFMRITLDMPATHQQVLESLKAPIKMLLAGQHTASTYSLLAHVFVIVQRAPVIFASECATFYVRLHDPLHIKRLKMDILRTLADENNCHEVVAELCEYAKDRSPAAGREAVRSVGRIALACPQVNGLVERLLGFMESYAPHIVAETLIQTVDLCRTYPDVVEVCLPVIEALDVEAVKEPAATAALVWVLGNFGQRIQAAPYMLEALSEGYADTPTPVRLALLVAAAKLFLQRPPEMQPVLGAILAAALEDPERDVQDRALLTYRLLSLPSDAQRGAAPGADGGALAAAQVVLSGSFPDVSIYDEDLSPALQSALFQHFNSLAVIFREPPAAFVDPHMRFAQLCSTEGGPPQRPAAGGGADDGTSLLPGGESSGGATPEASHDDLLSLDVEFGLQVPATAAEELPSGGGGPALGDDMAGMSLDPLAGLDDLMGGGGDGGGGQAAQGTATAIPDDLFGGLGDDLSSGLGGGEQGCTLDAGMGLDAAGFEAKWAIEAVVHSDTRALTPATAAAIVAHDFKDFSAHVGQANLTLFAHGGAGGQHRMYLFGGVQGTSDYFLVEGQLNGATLAVTVKAKPHSPIAGFVQLWDNVLLGFQR